MSLREQLQNIFKPREVKEAEEVAKIDEANKQERRVTADYLEGRISLEEYNQHMEETYPITKLDFRKLASDLSRHH